MTSTKLWGPLVGLEILSGTLGILGYQWITANPALHAVWPWILARATGLGAYGLLTVVVLLGMGISHPRWKRVLAKYAFGWHRTLTLGVFALIAIHGTALALDPYAHVSWPGLVIPGLSHYRPLAVGLGVVSAEGLLFIAVTAHLGQNWGRIKWITWHRGTLVMWTMTMFHSLWSGTDTRWMALFYEATTVLVGCVALLRYGTDRMPRLVAVRSSQNAVGSHRVPSFQAADERDVREHLE